MDVFGRYHVGHNTAHMIDDSGRLEVLNIQFHFLGFDFREIQDVVDDMQQVLGGCGQLVQVLGLKRCQRIAFHQMGKADHRIHGGSDFMAHIGQEGTFGQVGLFGRDLGRFQFLSPGGHQLFEVQPVSFQFPFGQNFFGDIPCYTDYLCDFTLIVHQ